VFNVLGAKVAQLVNEFKGAGYYHVEFNPSMSNLAISSGVYYYKNNCYRYKNREKS